MTDEEPGNRKQSEAERVQRKSEVHLALIALAIAAVIVSWGTEHIRQAYYIPHSGDLKGFGGRYASSAAVSDAFHGCLLMVPTVFLIRFMSKFEIVYSAYSKVLVGLSLTAPIFLAGSLLGPLKTICLIRLMASPFVLVGMGISRWMARFDLAKKLTQWALVIESVTLGIAVVLFFVR